MKPSSGPLSFCWFAPRQEEGGKYDREDEEGEDVSRWIVSDKGPMCTFSNSNLLTHRPRRGVLMEITISLFLLTFAPSLYFLLFRFNSFFFISILLPSFLLFCLALQPIVGWNTVCHFLPAHTYVCKHAITHSLTKQRQKL